MKSLTLGIECEGELIFDLVAGGHEVALQFKPINLNKALDKITSMQDHVRSIKYLRNGNVEIRFKHAKLIKGNDL